jgi:hypothetical protein
LPATAGQHRSQDAAAVSCSGAGTAARAGVSMLSGGVAGRRAKDCHLISRLDVCHSGWPSELLAVVGRGSGTMSDQIGARLFDQVRAGATARGVDVVGWGSTDALAAVKRMCQDVALRCQQAIATHHPGDASDTLVSAASQQRR